MFFTDSYCDYIGVSFQRSVQSHLPVSAVHVGLEMGDLNSLNSSDENTQVSLKQFCLTQMEYISLLTHPDHQC